jgi:site-specific DNA recombinase
LLFIVLAGFTCKIILTAPLSSENLPGNLSGLRNIAEVAWHPATDKGNKMDRSEQSISRHNAKMIVVAYYRKSSEAYDMQVTSIADQQKAVREFCESKGWYILAEYIDSGKSGSKHIHKRVEFLRMVEDSKEGEFTAVLTWDTSRFGRLDSQRGAPTKMALRDNGVHLETVRQGSFDWSSSNGRILDTVMAESDNKYSIDLSAGVVRGKSSSLAAGFSPHGRVPWGYDRGYYQEGELKMTTPRRERFRKSPNWKLKPIVNQGEAEVIRWIFDQYGNHDTSMRKLCRALSAKGVVTPSGKNVWSIRSIVGVLSNSTYVGDLTMGHKKGGVKGTFTQAAPQMGTCPAIIDRELWDSVKARLAERADRRRIIYDSATVKSGTLSGMLVCGRCGHTLAKKIDPNNGNVYYICLSNSLRPGHGCKSWRIHEAVLLPKIGKALADAIDIQIVQSCQAQPPERADGDKERLRAKIKETEKAVEVGTQNLLKSDSEIFPLLQKALMERKADLERFRNTLTLIESSESSDPFLDYLKWWNAIKANVKTLLPAEGVVYTTPPRLHTDKDGTKRIRRLHYGGGKPAVEVDADKLRALLRRLNVRLTIWWTPNGKRFYSLERGIMTASFIADQITFTTTAPRRENIPG